MKKLRIGERVRVLDEEKMKEVLRKKYVKRSQQDIYLDAYCDYFGKTGKITNSIYNPLNNSWYYKIDISSERLRWIPEVLRVLSNKQTFK